MCSTELIIVFVILVCRNSFTFHHFNSIY